MNNVAKYRVLAGALALVVCAFALSSCGKTSSSVSSATTAATSEVATTSSSDATTAATDSADATTGAATDNAATDSSADASSATTSDTTDEEIPRLPKVGMSADYLDSTELGEHDEEGEVLTGGKWKGGTPYYWRSKNGKDELVFGAIVKGKKVVNVSKYNTSLNYWADGTLMGKDFPDLYASGEKVEKTSSSAPKLEDPLDYSNGEEYADNAYKYFEYMGSDDPWNDALNYWDKNGR